MKETFEDYLQKLKDRRTEDDYKYTDEDFIQYEEYIRDCCKSGMSVYKCLEFMYFAEKEIKLEDVFNDEKKEIVIKVIQEHKQETVEEYFLDNIKNVLLFKNDAQAIRFMEKYYHAKKEEEQHDTLPGFIKQFDPKEGEIDEGAWTVSRFLKWLELNKFKIVK